MLTQKQHDLLVFIDKRLKKNSISPSYDEMKDALGLASKSGIHRLITALEERGFIRRLPHKARALEILKLPGDDNSTSSVSDMAIQAANDGGRVPLVGKIAAGTPIEAIQHDGPEICVPEGMLGRGEHFALEIEGESMLEAGIFDGDIAVIEKANTARNGQIVVAYVVEDKEATLKTLKTSPGKIELIAENKDYANRIFSPDEIEVQGVMVGLIRQYH